jgi:hypothetical protein
VVFARSARKELQALDHTVAGRILKRIEALTRNPAPPAVESLRFPWFVTVVRRTGSMASNHRWSGRAGRPDEAH